MSTLQSVRDLAWVINSPSLISGGAETGRIDPDQVDAEHLMAELSDFSGHRVGRYFERLVLYWLRHIRRVEIVAQSLPVRDGKRTIGEIDLLFRDEQDRLTHWEIAVKFYLHVPQVRSLNSHYLGPNVRDTFERKMQRLFEVQLPRSKRDFPDVEVRQAFVKGRIFYHPHHTALAPPPEHLSPEHLRCEWIRVAELTAIERGDDVFYRLVEKPLWLSEQIATRDDTNILPGDELVEQLREHFAKDRCCRLVSRLEAESTTGSLLVETGRMFVVPDHWPAADPEGTKPILED